MESWGYVSEGKGCASNDTHSPPTTLGRSKSSFLGWELKTFEDHQSLEELGFPDLSHDLIGGHGGTITSTSTCTTLMASPISISGRGDFNSKLSNSAAGGSKGRDSSLIDLKLGRFSNDHGDAMMDQAFSKGAPPVLPSSESSNAPKRARGSGWFSQTAYCQVYGCNKDLSSCKDYHKRHKVCEVHSKTATVIVNGIEQRFCQQCSRFHLLAEFDDGKRSCRKRLAGHNERRRKPQAGIHSGKASRLLQPCGDSRFQGTMLAPSPFICSEMLPSGVICSETYGTSGFWRPTKAEHWSSLRRLSSMTMANEHPQSRSLFPSYNQKQFPFLQETGAEATTGSIFGESNSQYQQHFLGAQNSGLRSLFQDTVLGYQDFNVFESFDTASTVQGLSGISNSGCALSLLSSQESQKSSSQSSGIPLDHPFIIPSSGSHHRNSMSQVSEKIGGISSTQTSSCRVSDRFPLELSPAGGSQLSPILISDNNDVVNFEMVDGIFQGSDYANVKGCLSCEVATIDLLQLSSQLQRVEHQRQSLQVKQENDSSCTLRIT